MPEGRAVKASRLKQAPKPLSGEAFFLPENFSIRYNTLMNYIVTITLLLLTSCASLKKNEEKVSVKAIEQVKGRSYLRDKVSVKTVIMQAHAAYLRGCLDQLRNEETKMYPYCRDLADEYVDEFVISILDQ